MRMTTEQRENDRAGSVSNLLGGLIVAGALATAWRLQRRLNLRRYGRYERPEPYRTQREALSRQTEVEPETITRASMVIGSFDDAHIALEAARSLRDEWPYGFQAYSPNLNEEFFEAMHLPHSPARFWILAGAIVGELGGWATTIMLSIYWPHYVAAMPVIAVPPFIIVSFEMMVLFGAAGGLVGLLFHCGLPTLEGPAEYLRRFQRDRIGIVLNCDGADQVLRAQRLLDEYGAKDIQYA